MTSDFIRRCRDLSLAAATGTGTSHCYYVEFRRQWKPCEPLRPAAPLRQQRQSVAAMYPLCSYLTLQLSEHTNRHVVLGLTADVTTVVFVCDAFSPTDQAVSSAGS
jgi:hypothetical protein